MKHEEWQEVRLHVSRSINGRHMDHEQTLKALRQALGFSPDNDLLRQHMAESLLAAGRPAEAEKGFRQLVLGSSANAAAKLGLATAFQQQGK
ncbi:MAG TPA: tetratricopeptide repeat protein, partial [Tepidisphaeraceae bacterium]